MDLKENDMVGLRQYALDYLYNSGFVAALVKKSIFSSDIDNLYEDFLQETWLAILEQKDELWEKLYNTALEKGTGYDYQLRNYFSRVILNTCKSDSSNAFRRLKKHHTTELHKNDVQWDVYENSIPDSTGIMEEITNMNDKG